jgi:hypothetical protein
MKVRQLVHISLIHLGIGSLQSLCDVMIRPFELAVTQLLHVLEDSTTPSVKLCTNSLVARVNVSVLFRAVLFEFARFWLKFCILSVSESIVL